MDQTEFINNQLLLLHVVRSRLEVLLQQEARQGTYTPPHIVMDIQDARRSIQQIKLQLQAENVKVDDLPNEKIPLLSEQYPINSRPLNNLPGTSYDEFVPRPHAYETVVQALCRRNPVVLVVGFGGTGKTSLAREIAADCLRGHIKDRDSKDLINAVVWVSDKDMPGSTSLNSVLDTIAHTLNHPAHTLSPLAVKQREINKLLDEQRVLLIIDNYETVKDELLFQWLLDVPGESKVLITTRESRQEFFGSRLVELGGMTSHEALIFIDQFLQQEKSYSIAQPQREQLVTASGGNPKAIEVALGSVLQSYLTLDEAVEKLKSGYGLRTRKGDLFDELFASAWSQLDLSAQRTLAAATFFPDLVDIRALSIVADVGTVIDDAVELLIALALLTKHPHIERLDQNQNGGRFSRRYGLHPLVRAFVVRKLESYENWEAEARTRWLKWATQAGAGWPWNNIAKLKRVGADDEKAIFAALHWAVEKEYHEIVINIAARIDHFYYVCGYWEKKNFVDECWIESARNLNDANEEAKSTAQHIQFLCRQVSTDKASKYLLRLHQLEHYHTLDQDVFTQTQHAYAFYALATGAYHEAYQIMEQCRKHEIQPKAKNLAIATLHWLSVCLYKLGQLDSAKQWFEYALSEARTANYERSAIFCQLHLANIALDQQHKEEAAVLLGLCLAEAVEIEDQRYIAQIQLAYTRYYLARGEREYAQTSLSKAEDLYKRLKLRDDVDLFHRTQKELIRSQSTHQSRSITRMQVLTPGVNLDSFLHRVNTARQRALLLDYDGTLAPFKEKRDEAIPREGVRQLLSEILVGGRTRVVIISGRSLDDIEALLGVDPLPEIWGSHGWEQRHPDGTRQAPEFSKQVHEGLAAALSFIEQAGLVEHVERKPASLAVHWRGLDAIESESIRAVVLHGWSPIEQSAGLIIKPFDGGLEMGVPGRDKGVAVRAVLAGLDDDAAIAYLGDDLTDEDAFRSLKGRGISIQVHDEHHQRITERETQADVRMWAPTELLPFLAIWR